MAAVCNTLEEQSGGPLASESSLRYAGTLLSRVRAPPPAPWPDGGPESLRTPCGLVIYKTNQTFDFAGREIDA
ncbi:hypothetical protein PoB_002841300 [Plakobranchus ocellatus]|uniref:Uncharacterized protein n=1 Tax=Plakobranchus ocellatus TaxID=259542 RepID=A0AAV4A5B4_9GAST|nr:hypothetical protein PoB_002841300 [Plakobranchus ocellatus]